MSWRNRLDDLPPEQRTLVEGGSLSQRFSKRSLTMTHPALIGGFYGFLISMALFLPHGYSKGWNQDSIRDLAFLGILLVLILAIVGHASLFMAQFLKRPPISLRRDFVYPMPFIGLSILSIMLVTEIESGMSDNLTSGIRYVGWAFLLIPGPIYVHLSWAPRWRLLCRLEEGLDPFEGEMELQSIRQEDGEIEDFDLEMAIEDIEEDPPLLHVADGEE